MEDSGINITDIAILGILLLSGLLALLRGFVHEVLSFAAWVGAALVTLYAFPTFQPYARQVIAVQLIADIATGAAIFLLSLIVFSMLARALGHKVQESGLSALDRTLGLAFGLVRGAVIVCLAWLFFAWLVPEAEHPDWVKEAKALPIVKQGAEALRDLVPQSFLDSLGMSPLSPDAGAAPLDPALQPAPGGTSQEGEPAYNEGERQDLDKTIQDLIEGEGGATQP